MFFSVFLFEILDLGQCTCEEAYLERGICALKGSAVDISCPSAYLSSKSFEDLHWFIKLNARCCFDPECKPQYLNPVVCNCASQSCTLTVRNTITSDYTTHGFWFTVDGDILNTHSGVTLTFTGEILLSINLTTSSAFYFSFMASEITKKYRF